MKYPITSKFNAMEGFRSHEHLGIDFAFPQGEDLRSIQNGIIEKVYHLGSKNIGTGVSVKWDDGHTAIYGHMQDVVVHEGQRVQIGQLLGHSGNTGNVVSSGGGGYHLHFGLKNANGEFIDPSPYIHYIEEMNDKLLQLANKGGGSGITHLDKISPTDILHKAMDSFGDGLAHLKIHTIHIFNQLFDTQLMSSILHSILSLIDQFL